MSNNNEQEIERRFLVNKDLLPQLDKFPHDRIEQGYLCFKPAFRVRLVNGGPICKGFLTVKGPRSGATRTELEGEISPEAARCMLRNHISGHPVVKMRYKIPADKQGVCVWEVDQFLDLNQGLIIAEIEMPTEDHKFERPCWLGDEVTEKEGFDNASLAQRPWIYRVERESPAPRGRG